VFGGDGNDVLLGDDLSNTLVGGPGDDHIDGRGGNDQLVGDLGGVQSSPRNGRDHLIGGTGNDSLEAGEDPSRGDTLDCGDDRDTASIGASRGGRGADLVLAGCEQVYGAMQGPFALFAPLIADDAPIMTVKMGGYAEVNRLTARLPDGTLVADRRIYLKGRDHDRTIGLRLNATGRRLIHTSGSLRVRVIVDKLIKHSDIGRSRYHDEFRTDVSLATR
jgi:Ca2+-binding RTX toxin-like protein